MRSSCALLLNLLLFVSVSAVQNMPAQSAARTDVYHVHFAKAALGKGAEEGDYLKKQGPNAPMPGHWTRRASARYWKHNTKSSRYRTI